MSHVKDGKLKSLTRAEKKRFWRKLFNEPKIGDKVRVLNIWDISLRKQRPQLQGQEGVIIRKEMAYFKEGRHVLYPTSYQDINIPIVTWEVRFKNGDSWHFVTEDLEVL